MLAPPINIALHLLLLFAIPHTIHPQSFPQDVSSPSSSSSSSSSSLSQYYLVIGSSGFAGGAGNTLIFYPSIYFFSILTKRSILINDHSDIGLMCAVIECGFPMLSTVLPIYPSEIVHELKYYSMMGHLEGKPVDKMFVSFSSAMPKSDWIAWKEASDRAASIVAIETGCLPGDVSCAEQVSLQRLFIGPVKPSQRSDILATLEAPHELSNTLAAIVDKEWGDIPRIDAAVHLRNQFKYFERRVPIEDPEYRGEVQRWLAGKERAAVFESIKTKLVAELIAEDYCPSARDGGNRSYSVFIVGDNEDVRRALAIEVEAISSVRMKVLTLRSSSSSSSGVVHVGAADNEHSEIIMRTLTMDWYVISLANRVFGWRLGGASLQSTFLHSAQRLGVTRCGRADEGLSKGFVLMQRRGHMAWSPMFQYGWINTTELI